MKARGGEKNKHAPLAVVLIRPLGKCVHVNMMQRRSDERCVSSLSAHRSELLADIPRRFVPIVYHPDYNISFMGLEKLHPFDAGKWGKVIHFLRGKVK